VKIILATGRSDLFVREFVDKLGVSQPVISCNGGLIRDVATEEILFRRTIGEVKARALTKYCLQNCYDTLAYTDQHVYYLRGSRKIDTYLRYNSEVEAAFQVPLREVQTVEDLPLPEVIKFLISGIDPQIAARIQAELDAEDSLSMVQSMSNVLDIMAKGVNKGEALLYLAQKFQMDLSQTAVFGDNFNDLSMLKLVGWPITVANAEEAVKQVARFIAPDHDDSGVAYAIEHYILEG
jgi:Cof subfamily protein (haloacid dehalogenase superfamily)